MKNETNTAPKRCSAGPTVGRGSICTVPNTNDWYLTTDKGVTLGPYQSRREAISMLTLLHLRDDSSPTDDDLEKAD